MPSFDNKIEDISLYDVVFVGYPIWVETAAPPIRSFLTTHDFAGKTVVPFCTSGTSSAEESYRLVRVLCPQSTVLEGIQIRRGTYDTAYDRVVAWLQKLGIANLNNEKGDENKQDLSRREFIRNSMMAGGAMLLSGVLPSQAQVSLFPVNENPDSFDADSLLRGVSDIHLHAAPDSKARLGNELEFARAAHKAGYKSMLFKSNDFSCHDRAYLIRQELPDFEVFGSLCMNRVHGDKVNVFAAEKAVATTDNLCRCIWMPTQDAVYQNVRYHGKKEGIAILDENGAVLPEVVRVMEICAEANIILPPDTLLPKKAL